MKSGDNGCRSPDRLELAGKYKIEKKIGEGTFGVVYRGRTEEETPRLVALKALFQNTSPNRILNEAKYMNMLSGCPNVCRLIDAVRFEDRITLVLGYFEHDDFQDYFGKMTLDNIQCYMRALFIALEGVHRHGIIHRDVKPGNFLYSPKRNCFLLVDFGLAQLDPSHPANTKKVEKERKLSSNSEANAALPPNPRGSSGSKPAPEETYDEEDEEEEEEEQDDDDDVVVDNDGLGVIRDVEAPVLRKRRGRSDSLCKSDVKAEETKKRRFSGEEGKHVSTKKKRIPSGPLKSCQQGTPANSTTVRFADEKPANRTGEEKKANAPTLVSHAKLQGVAGQGRPHSTVTRDRRDASRAGTRGFRAPEVLCRCLNQTTAVDMWAAGVILVTLLSGRYPFFSAPDDMHSLAEIMALLGTKKVKESMRRNKEFTNIRTSPAESPGVPLDSFRDWTTRDFPIPPEALDLLYKLLEPNPVDRITASQALAHPFLALETIGSDPPASSYPHFDLTTAKSA